MANRFRLEEKETHHRYTERQMPGLKRRNGEHERAAKGRSAAAR